MPPNTDRPINRAMVVGCAVSATRNHLKLHEPRKLNVLLSNIHAKTRKLWKHSAMRLAASRTNAAHQFTNRPLMNSVCPPRCPLHSPGLTCMHVASCWRRVHHRDRHQHTIPIALAAMPGAILPATSCLGAFWTPASSVRRACRRYRRPKTSTRGNIRPLTSGVKAPLATINF
jgi:hypothetical protein